MYSYDPAIFLIPEMDCVRILTNNYHEMIQKVPNSVNNIFAINSQKPSSWLFEAHKKYEVSLWNCERYKSRSSNVYSRRYEIRKRAISRTSIYV